jgi:hypothetical protein
MENGKKGKSKIKYQRLKFGVSKGKCLPAPRLRQTGKTGKRENHKSQAIYLKSEIRNPKPEKMSQ